jgi:hypothetical protein
MQGGLHQAKRSFMDSFLSCISFIAFFLCCTSISLQFLYSVCGINFWLAVFQLEFVHMLFTGFSKLKIWAEYKFQFCHDCNIAKCTKTITTNVVKTKIDATKITALQRKHLTNKSHLKLQIFLWVYFLNSYNCRVRCVYHVFTIIQKYKIVLEAWYNYILLLYYFKTKLSGQGYNSEIF